ncbi:fumarylacetoacetate hydrolase family protein [Aliamphritea ceti]|uniref:fumarylacetoacetate hydrolase family protein n=1 Tax=Aliamphritea ceti TaxID=1524258 RepID=UPI0021C42895|nr:fumarylacetoacetate hydrolase family protein [Aliamphritea ceti]
MQYKHQYVDGTAVELPVGKVICVGRNYAEHAAELDNPVPSQPMLFMKPSTALADMAEPLEIPLDYGEVHYETEIAILIGEPLKNANKFVVEGAIVGIGLGLDLTLRDLQTKLKERGYPWEKAKAFDASCPLSAFVEPAAVTDIDDVSLSLTVNGELRQAGSSRLMVHKIYALIAYMSHHFTLLPGDVVMTGTPAGVGAVNPGDRLLVELADLLRVETHIL